MRELLERVAEGDERAFGLFYQAHYQIILPFVLKYAPSREDAEEIMQQTFLRAWLHREKLPHIEYLKAWLIKVAGREYLNHVRNHLTRRLPVTLVADPGEMHLHSHIEMQVSLSVKEINMLINHAINKLSPQRKQVFNLSRRELLTVDQIATRMELSPKTVKNTLTAALAQIREYLSAAGYTISLIILTCHKLS